MAKTTHEKELDRARARRESERVERKRATTVVVSLVAALVVVAVGLGGFLLTRGEDAADVATAGDSFASGSDAVSTEDEQAAVDDATTTGEACPAPTGAVPAPATQPYDERPTADLAGLDTVTVTLDTTCGVVVLALDHAAAPTAVETFVALSEDGYYGGSPFHRVIDGFMIQGGDPTGTGTGCLDAQCQQRMPGYAFGDELELAEQVVDEAGGYPRGTLAMANAGADSNGSQFFIVQADPAYPLPPSYVVFGEVVEGMDVVDRIALGPVDGDQAIDPVVVVDVDVDRCAPEDC